MKPIYAKTYADHQQISLLLPWYVNKTLQGAELKAVEEHLTVCLLCKRELMHLQKLAQAVSQNGSTDTAGQAAFSRLKKRLHPDHVVKTPNFTRQIQSGQSEISSEKILSADKVKTRFALSWPRSAFAMAAALLLTLSISSPQLYQTNSQPIKEYRTLSSDRQLVAESSRDIRIVFAENIKQAQISAILDKVHGEKLSAQPTPQGVYTVRLSEVMKASQLLGIVEQLRQDSRVVFAEPAYALLSNSAAER